MTFRWSALALFCVWLAGCSVPDHVAYRLQDAPEYKDEEVRFHTVYYFRVLDTCRPPKPGQITNRPPKAGEEDDVILSDTLYRFTMVGKANAYFKKVQFESGTLSASQIDPFGNTVVKDGNGRLDIVTPRSKANHDRQQEIQAQLDKLDERIASIKKELGEALEILKTIKAAGAQGVQTQQMVDSLTAELKDALDARADYYRYLYPSQSLLADRFELAARRKIAETQFDAVYEKLDADDQKALTKAGTREKFISIIQDHPPHYGQSMRDWYSALPSEEKRSLEKDIRPTLKPMLFIDSSEQLAELESTLDRLWQKYSADQGAESILLSGARESGACPPGMSSNRGFLIFGPEGWRTFNQEERLILAMFTDSSPLIETLSQYSKRLNDARVTPQASATVFNDALMQAYRLRLKIPTQSEMARCASAPDIAAVRSCEKEVFTDVMKAFAGEDTP